jgi:hypothetical protein
MIVIDALAIVLFARFLRGRQPRELLPSVSGVFALGFMVAIVYLLEKHDAFRLFLCLFFAIAIMAYDTVLYFEKIIKSNTSTKELIHNRYLVYGRTAFWLAAFILVAFTAAIIQTGGLKAVPAMDILIPSTSIYGGGLLLVFLGFHVRLVEIEQL